MRIIRGPALGSRLSALGRALWASVFLWLAVLTAVPSPVMAQVRPPARPAPAPRETFGIRGFGDVGQTTFTAKESFEAVLGKTSALVFGGGVEAVLPQRIFFGVRVSRFEETGQRVFVFNDTVFPLGIDSTITVTPVEVTAGYRFGGSRSRVVPYGGGGIGWHKYEESSEFAEDAENVRETNTGYHVVGGVELRITRWLAASGEAQWTTVPDALGQNPNSVSAVFGETDLGGTTFRIKVVVGR
jgi:opacity protein-like surface antigen